MSYRDSFERCPRCTVTLVDAGSVRACNECRGLWVLEAVLSEMVLEMLPPGQLGRLELAVLERGGEGLACPSCGERMTPTTIHGVQLDRCPRQHGVWFDRDELQVALHSVGTHGVSPPRAVVAGAAHAVASAAAVQTFDGSARELVFSIQTQGQSAREVRTRVPVVKIGRVASAQVRLEHDDRVSRMHAVIEVASEPTIIDLGSSSGTFVNGRHYNKRVLRSGDRIRVGATTLVVTF